MLEEEEEEEQETEERDKRHREEEDEHQDVNGIQGGEMVRERGNMEDGWGGSRREGSDSNRAEEETNEVRVGREDASRTDEGRMTQRAVL